MKIRDLHRDLAHAWPRSLTPAGARDPTDLVDNDARLIAVRILDGEGVLALNMLVHARRVVRRWDRPPSLRRVAEVLRAHLGRSIDALGPLDIPGYRD